MAQAEKITILKKGAKAMFYEFKEIRQTGKQSKDGGLLGEQSKF